MAKIERSASPLLLSADISKEYYAILSLVSGYDGSLLIVKGWSVTLSLAGIALGFQEQHSALFGLGAMSAASFWFLDGLMKGYQYRYYVRMREIEYTAFLLNAVELGGQFGARAISAPRIDMCWGFKGFRTDEMGQAVDLPAHAVLRRLWWHYVWRKEPRLSTDWRADEPWRRSPQEIHADLASRFWWPNVALPHAVAALVGLALFVAAAADFPGLSAIPL